MSERASQCRVRKPSWHIFFVWFMLESILICSVEIALGFGVLHIVLRPKTSNLVSCIVI